MLFGVYFQERKAGPQSPGAGRDRRRLENEIAEFRVVAEIPLSLKLAPEVGLEPTTLRLRMILRFRIGADYLINFPVKLPGASGILLVKAPQPLVSARSCLHDDLSAGFAQDCRTGSRRGRVP